MTTPVIPVQVHDDDKSYSEIEYLAVFIDNGTAEPKYAYAYYDRYTDIPSTLKGYPLVHTRAVGAVERQFYREPRPSDPVPGPGYWAKLRVGAYISNKDYYRTYLRFTSPPVIVVVKDDQVNNRKYLEAVDHIIASDWSDTVTQIIMDHHVLAACIEQGFDPAQAKETAIRNLYGSLQRRQDINLGVLLAELRESIGLLGSALLDMASIIRALKRGRVSDALKVLQKRFGGVKTRKRVLNRDKINQSRRNAGQAPISSSEYASNMWLELQFGWLPILDDIYKLCEVISGSLNSEGDGILSFNGYGTDNHELDNSVLDVYGYPSMNQDGTTSFSGTYSSKVAFHATFRVSNDPLSILSQLGLTNPLSIAWELIPFSFVLDWFLPIGNWIDSLTATAGLELIQLSLSSKSTIKGTFHHKGSYRRNVVIPNETNGFGYDSFYTYHVCEYDSDYASESFIRMAEYDDEIPPMPLPSFTFEELLQPWKVITSMALLRALA